LKRRIIIVAGCLLLISNACKKSTDAPGGGVNPPPGGTDSTYAPVDPETPATIGFFGNSWKAKNFTIPDAVNGTPSTASPTDSIIIDVNKVLQKVVPYVYGNNSNLWMGQIVTQPSLMQYIKDLSPNIIRTPAGSVSDIYFWNGTDVNHAPADVPPTLVNADGSASKLDPWYGGNNADWTFALNNYYSLLSQTNSTGIITVNYGYARYGTSDNPVAAAAHLAADWVRYDNGRTKFWEIGNESYGNWEAGYRIDVSKNKDGQPEYITGALYGQHVKVFADSMMAAAQQIGATIYIGASLYQETPYNGAYASIQNWNQGVLANAANIADYFIVHNYFSAYNSNSTVSDILSTGQTVPATMMSYIKSQLSAAGVAQKPVALTEWNIQAVGSKQNTSYVAGVHAALTLGAIIKNGYGEASRWDLANGYDNGNDMGMFNHGDEPGAPLWNPRPAFYYMYYFQKYFGDRMVYDTVRSSNGSDVKAYASTFSSGQAGAVIINTGQYNRVVSLDFQHFPAGSKYYWYSLTGGTDNGSFSGQVYVNGTGPSTATGGPLNYANIKPYSAALNGTIKLALPPMSVIYLVADKK
jgi:hypothetical protein